MLSYSLSGSKVVGWESQFLGRFACHNTGPKGRYSENCICVTASSVERDNNPLVYRCSSQDLSKQPRKIWLNELRFWFKIAPKLGFWIDSRFNESWIVPALINNNVQNWRVLDKCRAGRRSRRIGRLECAYMRAWPLYLWCLVIQKSTKNWQAVATS